MVAGSAADLRWLPVAAVGVVIGVIGARATMPPGTWRARPGLPAAVTVGLAITFAYLTMESFLPLLLRELKDLPLILAGMPLTAAAIFWTAGAWYQARLPPERRPRVASIGGFVSAVGLAVAATLVFDAVPFWLAYPATAVGAFGCGLAFTICQTVAVEFAPPGQEGAATAGVQLSNLLGAAIGTSVTAIVIAHLDDRLPLAIGLSFVTTALAALGRRRCWPPPPGTPARRSPDPPARAEPSLPPPPPPPTTSPQEADHGPPQPRPHASTSTTGDTARRPSGRRSPPTSTPRCERPASCCSSASRCRPRSRPGLRAAAMDFFHLAGRAEGAATGPSGSAPAAGCRSAPRPTPTPRARSRRRT